MLVNEVDAPVESSRNAEMCLGYEALRDDSEYVVIVDRWC